MITYNPKDWFTLIFHFHRSDTFRILFPTMMLIGIVTWAACYLEEHYLPHNIPPLTIFHQIAGFIISLVLVFRINSAYDRWWEGRKLWGSLVNNCRNLAIKLDALLPQEEQQEREKLAKYLSNYPMALKEHLRDRDASSLLEFDADFDIQSYTSADHKPNYIASLLTKLCLETCIKNQRSQNEYLIVSENLAQLTDICGACERIKNTPIPYAYSLFIKKVIFLYIITMPLTFGLTIGYWAVPIVIIMFYAFASLELISEEIEDPFGTDPNDLPTDELAAKIKKNISEIMLNKK